MDGAELGLGQSDDEDAIEDFEDGSEEEEDGSETNDDNDDDDSAPEGKPLSSAKRKAGTIRCQPIY